MDVEKIYETLTGQPYPYTRRVAVPKGDEQAAARLAFWQRKPRTGGSAPRPQ